jgi:hypothetical protein
MGVFSEIDLDQQLLKAVFDAVNEDVEPGTPQQLVEERVHRMAEEMTDLAMLALDPEQKPLIQREARGISQILLRAKLMLSVFEGEDIEIQNRQRRNLGGPRLNLGREAQSPRTCRSRSRREVGPAVRSNLRFDG